MATQLAHPKVSRIEAAGGFLICCPTCGDRTIRGDRATADGYAVAHQRSHVTPDPADQVYL